MAIKKGAFAEYAESRENKQLSSAMEDKKYSHNRVFDAPKKEDDRPDHRRIKINDNEVLSIDTINIHNWKYSDRTHASHGNIDALATEFLGIGQQQPCIIRVDPDRDGQYELIIGERRWMAAKKAGIKVLAIIKNMSDNEAALAQAAENDSRENLSDYEKGISFSKLLDNKIIKQKDLIEKLGKSKQYISALLSFSKIPDDVRKSIGDISNFSAVAAERIKQISTRSDEDKAALVSIGHKFDGKAPGVKLIEKEVKSAMSKNKDLKNIFDSMRLFTADGRHVGTWRLNNNKLPAYNLPKGIAELIEQGKINMELLNNDVINVFQKHLDELRE